MKKASQHPLLLISVIFSAFLIGLFCGRISNQQRLSPSSTQNTAISPALHQPEDCSSAFINGKLNINSASVEDLILLPGIGESLAQRIVDYRSINGQFTSINALLNIKGIGSTSFERISSYITVGG